MKRSRRRSHQRGSAMLVTMIVVGALLAGVAVMVSMQMASNRSTDLTRSGMSALYCAEAGLAAARTPVAANFAQWNTWLNLSGASTPDFTEPTFLNPPGVDHDVDGDGTDDFVLYIVDNDDEPTTNNRQLDYDMQVFIVSRCTKFPDTPKEVRELVRYNGQAPCNGGMSGGYDGDGNSNGGC